MSERLIAVVFLRDSHVAAGNTQSRVGAGEPMSQPHELRIVRGNHGYFLKHYDVDGLEVSDTFHLTLDDAFHQAEFRFLVKQHEWTAFSPRKPPD